MSPASPEGGEPEGQKNDSIEAEAECLAEATGIPASVFREAMYPLPDQPPESGDTERVHRLALEAQGPIETLLGIIRLRGELGSTAIPRLEAAHDAIKRIVDGDNWRERWEAVEKGEPAPAPEHGAEGDENTGESKDLAWAVKRLAAFRDDLYHADHSRVRPVVTAYDLQAVEIVLAHLSAPRRAEGDEWEGERCQSCGRPYERVWAATNALWNAVVGGSAGLRCPECFDREARAAGFSPYWAVADGHFLIPENRRAEGDEEPCQPPGAEDTITVWFCAQEPLHAAYVSAASDEEFDYKDCSCGANLVKAPFVPASTLTEARRERDGLIDPGDKLQSAASRLAEWVRGQDAPYEVAMAAIEARSAVEQWTVARSLLAEGSSRDG
jgi:hypothetical protein